MNNLEQVKNVSEIAYQFLIDFKVENYADGRYDLGSGVYVNIETYTTKLRKDAKYESHKKYIDIQYMISGKELITVEDINKLIPSAAYDNQKDIIFYESSISGNDYFLREDNFLIFNVVDAHMPCIRVDNHMVNRKMVIKVPII